MTQLELNTLALELFRAALRGVAASELLARKPLASFAAKPLGAYQNIRLLSVGKAALPLAGAAEDQLVGCRLTEAVAVAPHGYLAAPLADYEIPPSSKIERISAAHPQPDTAGEKAAARALELAAATAPGDLLLVLISGGGSALLPAYAKGISLASVRKVFSLLSQAGATIAELNTTRKHLSRIGGGRLAAAARGDVLALAVSDVPGDDLSIIASGPTVPDASTFTQVYEILHRRGVWEGVPASVRAHVVRGLQDPSLETPKPGDARFAHVRTELLGSNIDALRAAREAAERAGLRALLADDQLEGDARRWGTYLGGLATGVRDPRYALQAGEHDVFLFGGETTLQLTGKGHGGRNQEVALAAAQALEGYDQPAAILSIGSDGVDGVAPDDAPKAAGALVTPVTLRRARELGLDAAAFAAENDSYEFFRRLSAPDTSASSNAHLPEHGGHIIPGPTHCNVMDLIFVLSSAATAEPAP